MSLETAWKQSTDIKEAFKSSSASSLHGSNFDLVNTVYEVHNQNSKDYHGGQAAYQVRNLKKNNNTKEATQPTILDFQLYCMRWGKKKHRDRSSCPALNIDCMLCKKPSYFAQVCTISKKAIVVGRKGRYPQHKESNAEPQAHMVQLFAINAIGQGEKCILIHPVVNNH